MNQFSHSLTVVSFFLVVVGATIFPFITSENDPVQALTLNADNSEQATVSGRDRIAQDTDELELPCLIHCNPPYDVPKLSAREINTSADDLTWHQIDTGEFCLIYCEQLNRLSTLPAE